VGGIREQLHAQLFVQRTGFDSQRRMGMQMNTVAGKRILYVDDEPGLALLGQEFLGDLGFLVTSTFSGSEALELFTQEDKGYDLVITDESMPGMSGIDLAKELKRISPRTPIILCSGHLLTMQEVGMEDTNIRAVLIKTEVCTRLPELIEKVLSEQAASAD